MTGDYRARVELRLLGPVEVYYGGQPVGLGRRRERLLLALLLLEPGRVVSADRLVTLLWEDDPPENAHRHLHIHVSRLRKQLKGIDEAKLRLTSCGGGYVVETDPLAIDAHRFRLTVEQARSRLLGPEVPAMLRESLALWRGAALTGVLSDERRERLTSGLEELRLNAYELMAESELALGRPEQVVAELIDLVERYPTRERLVGQLLVALHRLGRTHDALTLYRRARARIVEELGLEPGAELRRLHESLVRADEQEYADEPRHAGWPGSALAPGRPTGLGNAAGPGGAARPGSTMGSGKAGAEGAHGALGKAVTPAQLPAMVTGFTGRDDELSQLDVLAFGEGRAPVIAVTGGPGTGKSALVIHWAHRVAERFPDGQLFINMRGFDPEASVRPIDALAYFLRALDVAPTAVPDEVETAAAMFRSLLSCRRMLMVLDNAGAAEQIRALLPGTHQCLVVITSRDALTGLVAREGARRLALGALSSQDAISLLTLVIGSQRAMAEPEEIAELASACGQLPLALRIAAAHIYSQPHQPIADYVTALTHGETLGALEVDNDPASSVRIAFAQSFATLDSPLRSLFCLLGLLPGPDLSAETAAAVSGLDQETACGQLSRLAEAHLIEPAALAGRYQVHDLLRLYARQQAAQEFSSVEHREALRRLYRHYLSRLDGAAAHLYPQMLRMPRETQGKRETQEKAEFHGDAAAWLDAERGNLIAAMLQAADSEPAMATHLADAMRGYLWLRRNMNDWFRVAWRALSVAEAVQDKQATVAAMISIAHAQHCAAEYWDAADMYRRSIVLSRELGWLQAQGTALGNLAVIHLGAGSLDRVIELAQDSIAIYRELGHAAGVAVNIGTLGLAYRMAGRLREAHDSLVAAAGMHRESGAQSMLVMSLNHLGDTCRELGEHAAARSHLDEAIAISVRIGNRSGEAVASHYLASLSLDLGEAEMARQLAERALNISGQTGNSFATAYALIVLGEAHEQEGDQPQALARWTEALHVARKATERHPETEAMIRLASAYLKAGQLTEAHHYALGALGIAEDLGYRLCEASARDTLSQIHLPGEQFSLA